MRARMLILRGLVVLGIAAALGYGLFEGRRLIVGPELVLMSPRNGSAVPGPVITIEGVARNVAFLSIDGKQAYTDEQGNFTELLSPPSGYTVVTVAAKDRFGREAQAVIHLTVLDYCPLRS